LILMSDSESFQSSSALSFITDICGRLKDIKRTGWVRSNIPLPESDADHMHRCAMCALLVTQPPDARDDYSGLKGRFHPSNVDGYRVLRMALTHDLCESLAGDVTPFCDASAIAAKEDNERIAMRKISEVVGYPLGKDLFDLWEEYEAQETSEAMYCKDIDKFEMVVQAYEYEKIHLPSRPKGTPLELDPPPDCMKPLRSFYVTTSKTMKTPLFKRLDAELRSRREAMLSDKGWSITDAER